VLGRQYGWRLLRVNAHKRYLPPACVHLPRRCQRSNLWVGQLLGTFCMHAPCTYGVPRRRLLLLKETNRERCTSCSKTHMRLGSSLPSREKEVRHEMPVIEQKRWVTVGGDGWGCIDGFRARQGCADSCSLVRDDPPNARLSIDAASAWSRK
jgi:hypothetical protein